MIYIKDEGGKTHYINPSQVTVIRDNTASYQRFPESAFSKSKHAEIILASGTTISVAYSAKEARNILVNAVHVLTKLHLDVLRKLVASDLTFDDLHKSFAEDADSVGKAALDLYEMSPRLLEIDTTTGEKPLLKATSLGGDVVREGSNIVKQGA